MTKQVNLTSLVDLMLKYIPDNTITALFA